MFNVPAKPPRIRLKDKPPDQRQIAVMPLRALSDKRLDNQAIRVLGLVCSYANRAGITWVSKKTIGNLLKVSSQAISNQISQLKRYGYIEVVKKGYAGQRTETIRVIYNPDISLQDAMAYASSTEDMRSPQMIDEELKAMNESIQIKPIKNKRVITKSNIKKQVKVSNNMDEVIREIYLRVFKKEKEIKEKDREAIAMIEQSGVPADEILAQVEVILKMIASEGLRIPDDIYDISKKLLNAYR